MSAVLPAKSSNEILLPPDSYAYTQKEGSGTITTHVGPIAITATGQDRPCRYNPQQRRFNAVNLEDSVQQFPRAAEGEYIILENPAEDESFPKEANANSTKSINKGRRVVIPGPWNQALWPGQSAQVIPGHCLRSNQYLIAMIYNEDQAAKNWDKTIAKASQVSQTEEEKAKEQTPKSRGLPKPESFAVGTRIVICGTDVSFYIPPTGIEVLQDEEGKYVREAVTLEQLEYCCLVDESGKKEYPRGPKVVFPRPTQVFETDNQKRRKFKPLELNNINGVHLKVTADFEGPDLENDMRQMRKFKEGEELFVTGKTCQIYYPREELAIIEYGRGNKKHYSTAIPAGEARYVIQRETGVIKKVVGPCMLLCDPRTEIQMRRVLSPQECELMYPGNAEVLRYNQELAEMMEDSPSGRSGVVSEGDYRKNQLRKRGGRGSSGQMENLIAASGLEANEFNPEAVGGEMGASSSMFRGTAYTEPRRLTLNTKFDGVPTLKIWSGYAVLIVGANGERRVEIGPKPVLLEYGETVGHMTLSTGKPKSTDKTFTTAYLKVHNNQVGDIVDFESSDHVKGSVKLSLRVNFEGLSEEDKLRWFSVDNYVKYLCDHVRSIIAGMTKKRPIAEIKKNYVDLIRDAVLGQKGAPPREDQSTNANTNRPGLVFSSNGMRVIEVEVLDLSLADKTISKMLDDAQHDVVKTDIELDQARKQLDAAREKERINQEKLSAEAATDKLKIELERVKVENRLLLSVTQFDSELAKLQKQLDAVKAEETIKNFRDEQDRARGKAAAEQLLDQERGTQELKIKTLQEETAAAVKRLEAATGPLCEALIAMERSDLAAKVAEAVNFERVISGDDMSTSLNRVLAAFPLLQGLSDPGKATMEGINQNRLRRQDAKTPAKTS